MADLTPYQRDILIKTILGEARGEGEDGMAAVAHNILNRANSGKFSSDPAKVALQNKQYSTWNKGEGGNNPEQFKPGSKSYETAAQVLDAVYGGQIPDPTGGALYYHAKGINPSWSSGVNTNGTLNVGNHVFYPSRPVPPEDVGSGNAVATKLDTQDPSLGGKNPGPMFDAAYDSTIGSMRMLNNPIQSQGMAWGDSAPTPASVEDRVTARNTTPRQAMPQPGASDRVRGSNGWQTIATIPSRAPAPITASDRTRGSEPQTRENATTIEYVPTNGSLGSGPIGQPPATRIVQSVPVPAPLPPPRQQVSASDMVRGNTPAPAGSSNFAMPDLATSPFTKAAAFSGGADYPYRGTPLPPISDFDVAGKDQGRLDANVFPMAPGGFMPELAIMPMVSPNAMPPMPRSRPMTSQPQRLPQRSPLSIVVNGGTVRQPLPQRTAVQALQAQGLNSSQAYAAANANAKSRAQQNAQGYTAPKSGERRYDPDSGQWR